MYEGDATDVNSEIRFIALELMKISERKKRPFRRVAEEYISNVYRLRRLIRTKAGDEPTKKRIRAGTGEKRV